MLIAFYIGDHHADTLFVRLGCRITRKVQKGPFANVTHCEAIHDHHPDGSVTIASSSLRDGGVRSKRVTLDAKSWVVVNVQQWDVEKSKEFFIRTAGQKYDLRGAIATVFLGSPNANRWFCNDWVSQPFLKASATFGPHHLAAICLSIGTDVTESFFKQGINK